MRLTCNHNAVVFETIRYGKIVDQHFPAVFVSWNTGVANISATPLDVSQVGTTNTTVGAASFPVSYGTSATALTASMPGYISSYKQIYTGFTNVTTGAYNTNPTLNYTSQAIHHVQLTNLQPGTKYYYQVSMAC